MRLDGSPQIKYVDSAREGLVSKPTLNRQGCSSDTVKPTGNFGVQAVSYGSAYLTVKQFKRLYSDKHGTWSIQADHFTSNYPTQYGFRLKPSIYTTTWAGTVMSISTRVNHNRTCSYRKVGQAPVYFPAWFLRRSVQRVVAVVGRTEKAIDGAR